MSEEQTTENVPLNIANERIISENERLKRQLKEALDAIEKLTNENKDMQSFRDAEERGKLREELRQLGCTYGVEELDKMGLDELDKLKTHYKYFKPPVFKSSGDFAPKTHKNIYDSLYDKYIPLEERIKKMQE